MSSIKEAIKYLEKQAPDPKKGLPEEIFLYISRMVPMINVDLLIKNKKGRTLLSWRDDVFYGKGWHIPGGIIRFKEKIEERIQKVAKNEIGAPVEFDQTPITISQSKHDARGYFISLLYSCHVPENFMPQNLNLSENQTGFLKWHESCPKNLLKVQDVYKKFINN